jgi:iron complex outermembrane receptor protein
MAMAAFGQPAVDAANDLTDLSLSELSHTTVTSASRKPESVEETASAVFVITQEDIRRSGVTSVPEALRMAPGVHVARSNDGDWYVAIRGFNGELSNKLLVMIDGRSMYSPVFSGVFWYEQDLLMEDIERIEVIGAPVQRCGGPMQ